METRQEIINKILDDINIYQVQVSDKNTYLDNVRLIAKSEALIKLGKELNTINLP